MNTETENRTVTWDAQAECSLLHKRIERQAYAVDRLSARIDALEQARSAGATVVNDHASRIETMADRIDAGFARIRDLRTDPITQPLPASPAPVEPAPVPETPETPEDVAQHYWIQPGLLIAVLQALAKRAQRGDAYRLRQCIHTVVSDDVERAALLAFCDLMEGKQAPALLETPEQTATRFLGDPETFAAVLRSVARHGYAEGRQKLHDAIRSQEAQYHSNAAGLRLLAAAIAAGSFA